ncbi:asparagine synthase C-terminal domain-containing protein [Candidatus Nitrosopelagicus sp.]|nr:asparagine synthase C-terminal domain-containing protein [Candidatus Nitrosopelagicus sp.]
MGSPNKTIDTTSLVNILTLRYDSTQTSLLPKYTSSNFANSNEVPNIEKIENLIIENISSKIKKDVDSISIALSGGVDSTLILAIIRKLFPDLKINAISVKFANSIDETIPAAKIAENFDANHSIIEINNYLKELPKAISIIKQPFWDTHWYYVTKKANSISKYLASGDGGDEIFGGYTFRYQKFLNLTNDTSTPNEKIIAYLNCHERDNVPDQKEIFHNSVNFNWTAIHKILLPYFQNDLSRLDQVLLADYNGKLLYNFSPVNTSLQKYFQIESISPLLSPKIISYFMPLHNNFKYDKKTNIGKPFLRNLLKKYNAHTFVGKQKLGFNANTIELWNSYGKKICEKYLIDGEIIKSNIINADWINRHIDKENLEIRYVNKFLGLLAVEIWYRLFITNTIDSETTLD